MTCDASVLIVIVIGLSFSVMLLIVRWPCAPYESENDSSYQRMTPAPLLNSITAGMDNNNYGWK
jgi:hypothetical protein